MARDTELRERIARAARDLRVRERDALRTRALTALMLLLCWACFIVWVWPQ